MRQWEPMWIAWAAGFFDGEGSITAPYDRRGRGSVRLEMTVVQASPDEQPPAALLKFHAIVQHGQLHKRKKINGHLGRKAIWQWRCGHIDHVKEITARMRPWLIAKAQQADTAIAVREAYERELEERRNFCKRGHDLRIWAYENNQRSRNCRLCNQERMRSGAQKGG